MSEKAEKTREKILDTAIKLNWFKSQGQISDSSC